MTPGNGFYQVLNPVEQGEKEMAIPTVKFRFDKTPPVNIRADIAGVPLENIEIEDLKIVAAQIVATAKEYKALWNEDYKNGGKTADEIVVIVKGVIKYREAIELRRKAAALKDTIEVNKSREQRAAEAAAELAKIEEALKALDS